MKTRSWQWWLWTWAPPVLWMVAITGFSTDSFSAEKTQGVIEPIVRYVAPEASGTSIDLVNIIVRKLAHFGEYGLLALLWYRAFHRSTRWSWLRAVIVSLVISWVWAISDEVHQIYVPSRTASALDVMIDASGATCGLLLASLRRFARLQGPTTPT